MSVISVKRTNSQIEVAADSITIYGETTKRKNGGSKLFEDNGMIIGSCGAIEEIALMRIFSKTHKPQDATESSVTDFICEFADWKRKKTDDYSIENDYILVYDYTIFACSQFCVCEVSNHEAIGIGSDFALAALHMGKSAKQACEIACELSTYCDTPVNTIKVKL